MKTTKKKEQVCADGFMTFGKLENGLLCADFACCEEVRVEQFSGSCKVQIMRDGNVYMTEQPKRVRNKALFREDNASLSHGRDGRWYFCFSLDGNQLEQLPDKLVKQAGAIAWKMRNELINDVSSRS